MNLILGVCENLTGLGYNPAWRLGECTAQHWVLTVWPPDLNWVQSNTSSVCPATAAAWWGARVEGHQSDWLPAAWPGQALSQTRRTGRQTKHRHGEGSGPTSQSPSTSPTKTDLIPTQRTPLQRRWSLWHLWYQDKEAATLKQSTLILNQYGPCPAGPGSGWQSG